MFDLALLGGRAAFDDLVHAVLEAGDVALKAYYGGAGTRAEQKPDRSPVTEADRAVEQHLLSFVGRRFPHASFYGEETGGSEERAAGIRFIVNPIDGTRAFMRGLPTWSVLVGVEHDGEPVAGVAYMPASGELYSAVRGHGAYANGRPVRLSRIAQLEHAMICHGGLAQFTDGGVADVLPQLALRSYTQRGLGDFAGYAALLKGQADGVIDPAIKPYDVAAACVIVREAGGRFTSFDGKETLYGPGGLASNGLIHDELLGLFSELGAPDEPNDADDAK